MAGNVTVITCTKHVDIKYKYLNEYIEDGMIKIVFIKLAENDGNMLTKNPHGELHEKHFKKIICLKPE